jgi:hypothetical protein
MIYREVGFARSFLAYELPDGRLKLLGGHLRHDLDPDMEVDVEVLDVTEEDARKLLLTIAPLAALALTQEQIQDRLREITPVDEAEKPLAAEPAPERPGIAEQFLILVTCRDEEEQVAMLGKFIGDDLRCKARVG